MTGKAGGETTITDLAIDTSESTTVVCNRLEEGATTSTGVLGRPGAGCSTFLKAIANDRGAFAGVNGEVSYGGCFPGHACGSC
jgi:ATPase subunit of ABC transporter with duplicated ATPase domains